MSLGYIVESRMSRVSKILECNVDVENAVQCCVSRIRRARLVLQSRMSLGYMNVECVLHSRMQNGE